MSLYTQSWAVFRGTSNSWASSRTVNPWASSQIFKSIMVGILLHWDTVVVKPGSVDPDRWVVQDTPRLGGATDWDFLYAWIWHHRYDLCRIKFFGDWWFPGLLYYRLHGL